MCTLQLLLLNVSASPASPQPGVSDISSLRGVTVEGTGRRACKHPQDEEDGELLAQGIPVGSGETGGGALAASWSFFQALKCVQLLQQLQRGLNSCPSSTLFLRE